MVEIKNQAEKFIKQRKGDKNNNQNKIDTIAEEDKSDIEESPGQPQKNPIKQRKQRRQSNLDLATVEDKQITFVSNHSNQSAGEENEDEEEEKSDTDIVNEQTLS
jgi:hypothetical protein